MSLIQNLREKFGARQRTANETYWSALRAAAAGKATDKQLIAVEESALAIGKTADQLAADLVLLEEHAAALANLANVREQAARIPQIRAAIAEDQARKAEAARVLDEANARLVESQTMLGSLTSMAQAADAEVSRCAFLLERAGAPPK